MSEDIALRFDLPSVCRKTLSVGFDDFPSILMRELELEIAALSDIRRRGRMPEFDARLIALLKE